MGQTPTSRKEFYNSGPQFPAGRKWAAGLAGRGDKTSSSALPISRDLAQPRSGVAQCGVAANYATRRGWACPALVPYHDHTSRAGQAQPLRDAQNVCRRKQEFTILQYRGHAEQERSYPSFDSREGTPAIFRSRLQSTNLLHCPAEFFVFKRHRREVKPD